MLSVARTRRRAKSCAIIAALGEICGLAATLCSSAALGHHSAGVYFNVDSVVELSGKVTGVVWRNPHVHFTVQAVDGESWNVESNSVSILRRMGLAEGLVNAGDRVRIAGWPGRQRQHRLFALNMLLPDAVELILWPGATARWSDDPLGTASAMAMDGESSPASLGIANDIFRVWGSNMANPASFPLFPDVAGAAPEYPLTEAAQAIRATWNPAADNPYLTCDPVGMPRIMGQPYPMEFIDEGDRIVLRIELYDVVRTIHMADDGGTGDAAPPTPQGYSRGTWEGSALVVRTNRLSWPYFDQSGIPQSLEAELLERFRPSADGTRLEYTLVVTDPETFTGPVTLEKYWTWRPEAEVRPFECNTDYRP